MIFPPQRLEEAQTFSVCTSYKSWHICIYAGGGSRRQHNMYWGFVIYTGEGDRYHYGGLPSSCLDVDDGRHYCEDLIDKWEQPLGYEEVRLWRDICEFLAGASHEPLDPAYIATKVQGCYYLISPNRIRRQLLWDLYKIQLIKWEEGMSRRDAGGWRLEA